MWVLGVNAPPAGWHDASACLVDERGVIAAYGEEERFSRVKHSVNSGPAGAASYCLAEAGIQPEDVDVVAAGWDVPYVSRLFPDHGAFAGSVDWVRKTLGWDVSWRNAPDVVFVRHHVAHATVALHGSGYDSAAVVVVDGNGDDESISIFHATPAGHLVRKRSWPMSHSLGWLYDATSRFIGLDFLDAGKTMGLAAYGRARRLTPWPLMRPDGEDFLRPPFDTTDICSYDPVVRAWGRLFEEHAGYTPRVTSAELDKDPAAVATAWSAQRSVEEHLVRLADLARTMTGESRVCLAGGVALNCCANGLIADPLYVPPVPHDAGVAIGAAWHVAPPAIAPVMSPYLGCEPGLVAVADADLDGLIAQPLNVGQVHEALAAGRLGAVVEGRAEAGPRALGHRSIIASAADAEMRNRINTVKSREQWRPFAPVAAPATAASLWERRDHLARYMIGSVAVGAKARAVMPAAVHVDGTCRPQELPDEGADLLRALIGGDDGVLVNTSFNGRGQPIVNTAQDAIQAFRAMALDFLALDGTVYAKERGWWCRR